MATQLISEPLLTLDHLEPEAIHGRRVLVRVDFNLPMLGEQITDDSRLTAALPTLHQLLDRGARLALISHRGRPNGERRLDLSLAPMAAPLAAGLGRAVAMASDCVGPAAQEAVERLEPGDVCLLENLRFHAEEKANDPGFADRLAALADTYVSDAFASLHREHASTAEVVSRFSNRAAGRLVEREVAQLSRLVRRVERPFVALVGGAKIRSKIDTLRRLVEVVDVLLVGGAMANTFLVAEGAALGDSLFEPDQLELACEIRAHCQQQGVELILPNDLVVTDDLEQERPRTVVVAATALTAHQIAGDIGPETSRRFATSIEGAQTLFWNGPMGIFEKPPFDVASRRMAQAVGDCSGFTVVGGGETGAVVKIAGVESRIDHISTGGGASLALIAGKRLPGLLALSSARSSNQATR